MTGGKIKFMGELITNITFKEKNLEIKIVCDEKHNLFGIDWME